MRTKKIIEFSSIVVLTLSWFSCDKDYNTLGADIIGDNHYTFGTPNTMLRLLLFT